MKKMLKGLAGFAVVLVLVIGVVGTVFAADSVTGIDVTDASGEKANYTQIDTTEYDGFYHLTEQIASGFIGIPADQLKVVAEFDLHPTANPYTFSVPGYTGTDYIFHWNGTGWEFVGSGANPHTQSFSSLSPVGVVIQVAGGANGGGANKSDKTGQSDIMLYIALAAVAVGSIAAVAAAKNRA